MVYSRTSYFCDKCRSEHYEYDGARACERQHIVDDALTSFRAELTRIMPPKAASTPKDTGDGGIREARS